MAYKAATIANYFLDKASKEGRAVTPMQLIKLVYIAHGWALGYTGEPLLDETVQAWKYGPVIKSLYDSVKRYGSGAVSEPIRVWGQASSAVGEDIAPLLDSVWKNYSPFSGVQLSAMTHLADTPWWKAWHDLDGKSQYFAEIPNDLIERHYKDKIASLNH